MREKLLFTLVLVLGVMAVTRAIQGFLPPDGVVVWLNLVKGMSGQTIEVDKPTLMVIDATVSATDDMWGPRSNAWILDAEDRTVVWDIQRSDLLTKEEALRHVKNDTLTLDEGLYEVYYAAYGRIPSYVKDRDAWQFVLRAAQEDDESVRRSRSRSSETSDESVIWSAAQLEDEEHEIFLFEVLHTTSIMVKATGEVDRTESDASEESSRWFDEEEGLTTEEAESQDGDYSFIENMVDGTVVWSLRDADTEPAGGAPINQKFEGSIRLRPGIYRAVARTNRRHAYNDWIANPPYDPKFWGIELSATEEEAVVPFDLWKSREAIASFMRVGNDEERARSFRVMRRVGVILHTMGEITVREENVYDYGQLVLELPDGEREVVWRLNADNSYPAGGARKNRQAVVLLR